MDFKSMTVPALTDDQEFRYLEQRLNETGTLVFADTVMPEGSHPARAAVIFTRTGGFSLSLQPAVSYSGPDAGFAELCRRQRMDFKTMDEMKSFLREMKLDPVSIVESQPNPVPEKKKDAIPVNGESTVSPEESDLPVYPIHCRTAAIAVLNSRPG